MAHYLLPYKTIGRNWRNCGYTIHVMARASDGSRRYLEGKVKVGHVENFCGGEFLHSPCVNGYGVVLARNPAPRDTGGDWDMDTGASIRDAQSGRALTQELWEQIPCVGDRRFWWGPEGVDDDSERMFYMLAGVVAAHIMGSGTRGGVYFAGPVPERDVAGWPDPPSSESFNCYRILRGMAAMRRARQPFLCTNIEQLGYLRYARDVNFVKTEPTLVQAEPPRTFTNPNSGRLVAHMAVGYANRNNMVPDREFGDILTGMKRAYGALYRRTSNADWRIH